MIMPKFFAVPLIAWLLLTGLNVAMSETVGSSSLISYKMLAVPDYTEDEKLQPTQWMPMREAEVQWLSPLLEVLKIARPRREISQTLLINGLKDEQYLVTSWSGRPEEYVDFHRVIKTDDGKYKLKFLRRIQSWSAGIVYPTGRPLDRDGVPVVVVESASGGSGSSGYYLNIIAMESHTVDVTPDWAGRVVDVVDLNSDGQFEVVAMDGSILGLFDTRGGAGPFAPAIMSATKNGFTPACHQFADAFESWVALQRSEPDEDRYLCFEFEDYTNIIFAHLQRGDFAAAHRELAALEKLTQSGKPPCYYATSEATLDMLRNIIAKAEKQTDKQCPLLHVNMPEIIPARIRSVME